MSGASGIVVAVGVLMVMVVLTALWWYCWQLQHSLSSMSQSIVSLHLLNALICKRTDQVIIFDTLIAALRH